MKNHNSEAINVSGEFQKIKEARERQVEELARAFVEGGIMLARLNDPVRQFEEMVYTAAQINAAKREEAQRQFQEIVKLGGIDVGLLFDVFAGIAIYKISPLRFYTALLQANEQTERGRHLEAEISFKDLYKNENITKKLEFKINGMEFENNSENFKSEWKPTKDFLNENFVKFPLKEFLNKDFEKLRDKDILHPPRSLDP